MKTANMNITDQQKETLATEATKIFIQNSAWKIVPKMVEISNKENSENIFKGQAELIIRVFRLSPFGVSRIKKNHSQDSAIPERN